MFLDTIATDSLTNVASTIADALPAIEETIAENTESISGLNTVWMLLAAMLVFWMQPGFALVEAGLTRSKNTANILMKNFCDFIIGSILFWLVGYGLMYGTGNGFIGHEKLGWIGSDGNVPAECMLIFQTMFAATSATIVSGAMAERTKFSMYLLYSIVISLLIYPIEGHWSWGGGWLSELGFHDFAGSTVVHACGGFLSLAGAIVLGPRIGKYGKDGKSRAIPGHSLSLVTLGTFILWLGWFGFNPGSQMAADGAENATAISHVMVTTNMGAVIGGLTALLFTWVYNGKPSLSMTCNGILAGLVGVTAGCDTISIEASLVVGAVASFMMCLSVNFIDKVLKVDDPVGAISVHGVGGLVGTILVGVFGRNGETLGAQLIGGLTVSLWALACGFVLFTLMKAFFGLRVDRRVEEEGLDIYEHGESAYNA